jgi:hypothetical protein
MERLFTRDGVLYEQEPELKACGTKVYTHYTQCDDCSSGNAVKRRVRYLWWEQPRTKMGFHCHKCKDTGIRSTRKLRLYTEEQIAKLRRAEKAAAAKRELWRSKESERAKYRNSFYYEQNKEFLDALKSLCSGDKSSYWDNLYETCFDSYRTINSCTLDLVRREVAKRSANPIGSFVGAIGDGVVLAITIHKIITKFSELYGYSFSQVCRDQNNNIIVYTSNTLMGYEGDTLTVIAFVKEHKLCDDERHTIVERVKIVE